MHHQIPLNFKRQHLEEIYFVDHNQSLIKGPTTKRPFLYFSISLIAFITAGFYYWPGDMGPFFYISAIVLAYSLNKYYLVFKGVRTWLKQIEVYLAQVEQYQHHEIILTDGALTLVQDDKTHVETWDQFTALDITPVRILLVSDTNYILPAKSMQLSDYDLLKKVLTKKIQLKTN